MNMKRLMMFTTSETSLVTLNAYEIRQEPPSGSLTGVGMVPAGIAAGCCPGTAARVAWSACRLRPTEASLVGRAGGLTVVGLLLLFLG